jgi:FkbM family methyltransferase
MADDLSLTPDLVHLGYFEPSLSNYINKNITQGMNVVDVGANIGYFSVLLGFKVGPNGKITAYEPNLKAYIFLMDNLAVNGHTKFSTVREFGVYSEKALLSFSVSDRFQGNSSIKKHSDQYIEDFRSDTQSATTIRTVKLDDENLGYVDFMKIDTEGGEYHVFLGMENMLANNRVGTIVFELNKSMLQEDISPFYHLLLGYEKDYNFYLINLDGDLIEISVDGIFQHDFIENIVMKKG